jgi:hypothetical protein
MDLSKPYVEYYAKLNVDIAMRLRPTFLRKSERPDFVSRCREVGLEVTRAVIEQWAQQEADMNRHFGPDMPGEAVEQTILADCNYAGVALNESGNRLEPLLELPQDVRDLHIARIQERIEDKTRLLKEYQSCRQSWLYVFSDTIGLEQNDLERIQAYYDAQTGAPLYNIVFVKVGCVLYVLRRGEGMQTRRLSRSQSYRAHVKARGIALWVCRKGR